VPLFVSRVILPDSSGIPVLQDLAALREAVARGGGDASRVDTLVPVDFVVDHSCRSTATAPDALAFNMSRELARNEERYEFLRWCQANFNGVTVYPPERGSSTGQPRACRARRVRGHDRRCAWAFPISSSAATRTPRW
jgi:aconitate hydratase